MKIDGDGIFIREFFSDLNQLEHINQTLQEIFSSFSLGEDLQFRIEVCLTEAVNNAFIHGNGLSKSKSVIISCINFLNFLRFTIKDEGSGFNFQQSFNRCLKEPYRSQTSGRGIFLISCYSDDVKFLDRGRVVQLDFLLNDQ